MLDCRNCISLLKKQGIGRMPKVGLHDSKYEENYTDEIYQDLYSNQKDKKQTLDMHIDQLLDKLEENFLFLDQN